MGTSNCRSCVSIIVVYRRTLTASQAIIHSDWLTFTDPEAGYSIRYPASFGFYAFKDKNRLYRTNSIHFYFPNVHIRHTLSIQVEPNPNRLPIETMLRKLYEQNSTIPFDSKLSNALTQITIAGITAYQTTILPSSIVAHIAKVPDKTYFHILLPYNDKIYLFALLHDSNDLKAPPEVNATFFQMLDTFHLRASSGTVATESISETQVNVRSNWLTFIDEKAGYSIQYPANLFLQSGLSKGQLYPTIDISFGRYQGMGIHIEANSQNLPVDRFLRDFYQRTQGKPLSVEAASPLKEVKVAGMNAYQTNILYGDTQILLAYKEKVYIFSLGYTIAGGVASPEEKALFFQILDTFQITP